MPQPKRAFAALGTDAVAAALEPRDDVRLHAVTLVVRRSCGHHDAECIPA